MSIGGIGKDECGAGTARVTVVPGLPPIQRAQPATSAMKSPSVVSPLGPTNLSPGDLIPFRISVTNNGAAPINGVPRVYVRFENGRETDARSVSGQLGAGQTFSRDQSVQIPMATPPGTTFRIVAQVETALSFDEDSVEYTVE